MLAAISFSVIAPGAPPARESIEKLVDHCWSAQLAEGVVDRHCFLAMYGGMHIKDEHVVTRNGQPVYSGETVYSVGVGALTFVYFNSLGGVGRGTVTRNGNHLYFRMRTRPVNHVPFTPDRPSPHPSPRPNGPQAVIEDALRAAGLMR